MGIIKRIQFGGYWFVYGQAYLFDILILALVIDIVYFKRSLPDLIVLATTTSGVIAALSGLCYSGARSITQNEKKHLLTSSGHRFLHCLLLLVFGMLLAGTGLWIQSVGLFGKSNVFMNSVGAILKGFGFVPLLWAGESFLIGYKRIRRLLDKEFPFQDRFFVKVEDEHVEPLPERREQSTGSS